MSMVTTAPLSSTSIALRLLTDAAIQPSANTSAIAAKDQATIGNGAGRKHSMDGDETRILVSLDAAEKFYGSDSFLMQAARGRADTVEISIAKVPEDKVAYKEKMLRQIKESWSGDAGWMEAFRTGKVVIQTMDEVPELNMQPWVSYTLYLNGSHMGSGGFTPAGFNFDQLEEWSKTRVQGTFGDAFGDVYAYYLK